MTLGYFGELDQEGGPGVQPPKRKGWSTGGQMIACNDDKNVALQATFSEPGAYTVSFNIVVPPLPATNVYAGAESVVRADAIVTWSVDGNSVTRRVSIGDGVEISGIASAVSVSVYDVTDRTIPSLSTEPIGAGIPYNVTILVAPGTRPSQNQPAVLDPFPKLPCNVVILDPGGSPTDFVLVPVPSDAGVISVHVAVCAAVFAVVPDSSIQVQHNGFVVQKIYDPRATDWEPVTPGTTQVVVTNLNAFQVYVQLVFGVDG